MKPLVTRVLATAAMLAAAGTALAADNASAPSYQQLQQNYSTLQKQMMQMQKQMAAMQKQMAAQQKEIASAKSSKESVDEKATEQSIEDLYNQINKQSQKISQMEPGSTNFLIVGDANVTFTNQRGTPSQFSADVSPIIDWQLDKRLLLIAGFDFFTNNNDGSFQNGGGDVSIIDLSYILNDYMTVGGGMFPSPFAAYNNYFGPPWIEPMVDAPEVYSYLTPANEVGGYLSGAVPVGPTHFNYNFYVSNGPDIISSDQNPNGPGSAPGALNFGDTNNYNNGKAVGGRIGFVPIPSLEVGYSFEYSEPVTQPSTAIATPFHVNAFLQAVDFNYGKVVKPLDGLVRVRGSWIFSSTDGAVYPGTVGPDPFNGHSNGGFVELYYQPTLIDVPYLKNLGYAFRYDRVDIPGNNPGALHEQRYSLGLNYWLYSDAVIKGEYEFDNVENTGGNNAFFLQFAVGI